MCIRDSTSAASSGYTNRIVMSQKRLQTVLENACQTGVYHLPESGLAAVREAADALGLACFEVSLADVVRIDAVPVSYTHLDVYKRQSPFRI